MEMILESFIQAINSNPWFFVLCLIILVGPLLYISLKLRGIQSANMIIKEQFNPLPKIVIEQGFDQFKGEELRRYKTLVLRIRSQYGHNCFKVGHMVWILSVLEDNSIDVETVNIPPFTKPYPEGTS